MTPEWWARMEALFLRALDCPPGERVAFLDRECGGDEALRHEVEAMLATNERLGGFLEAPAAARESSAATSRPPDADASALGHDARARGKRCERCDGRFAASYAFCPEDGSPLKEDPEALVGTTLDGLYRIEALLGQGGMGAVYRAVHVLLSDVVAIKVLPREVSDNPSSLRRFRQEGRAARRFRHPSAVTVYDLRVAGDGTVFLVLEYVEGETLRVVMGRGRFAAEEALRVLEPVASCLDAAHRAGVVHRDVKPENIMKSASGEGATRVKVLDLGIARLPSDESAEAATNLTHPGAALGTPRYISPEQWGEPQRDGKWEIDGRADVYSLAVVAYEMVVGEPPFAGKSWNELRRQHTSETPPPAHERVDGLPEAYGLAVARAMSKDRADRFTTAGEFVRALREAVAERGEARVEAAPQSVETGAIVPQTAANPPTNLPWQLTSFVGREREVAEVTGELEAARLVTIVGPGGIGKTRLALRAASDVLDRFPDGVWFVDLARLADPSLVALTVATALGATERTGTTPLDVLCEYARARRFLLVLDNCEHLLEACSAFARQLLRSCLGVKVLATSRAELALQGEVVWQAPPLATEESVCLFAARAGLAHRGFAVTPRNAASVEELCRRLEGLPLAVELAAARMRMLTPAQLLERLGGRLDLLASRHPDVPSRHRTLRATIEWSYGLLDEPERRTVEALSVFRGGWTLDAAEAVVDADADVVDVLERLASASMIGVEEREEEMRYRMLESIREYGLERLAASGAALELQRRHAAYFLALAEAAAPELWGARDAEWIGRLQEEYDNIRAALQWFRDHDGEACLNLGVALRSFWMIRGYMGEGRQVLVAALERSPSAPAKLRWIALQGLCNLARQQRDLPAVREYLAEAARVATETADPRNFAWLNLGRGWLAELEDDLLAARSFWQECLVAARQANDDNYMGSALNCLGELARNEGDWAAARELYEQALASTRRAGTRDNVSLMLANLGAVACEQGDLAAAHGYYRDAMAIAQEIGSKEMIVYVLEGLGAIAANRGAPVRAGRLSGATEALRETWGFELDRADIAFRERYLAEVRAAVGDARLEEASAEGREMTLDQAIAFALEEES